MCTFKKAIMMHQKDNVATILDNVSKGEKVKIVSLAQETLKQITIEKCIPLYHKIALGNIPKGAMVVKYGNPIGKASKDILKGEHVHIQNVESIQIPLTKHMLS